MKTAATFTLLLSLAGCAHRGPLTPPRLVTVYHCDETADTPDGRLSAEPERVGWQRGLGDNLRIEMGLDLNGTEGANFPETGFANRFADHPHFFIVFDPQYGGRNTIRHLEVAGEVRIGRYVVRQWMPSNMVLFFNWRMVRELLQGTGDVHVTLYDTSGAVLQRGTMDRGAFERVERGLRALYTRVRANLADRERLCRVTLEPEAQMVIIS